MLASEQSFAAIDGIKEPGERELESDTRVLISTELSSQGIRWQAGDEIKTYNPYTAQIELFTTPDQLRFAVETFNRQVITEPFNRVVCDMLADELDPFSPYKTLIFCASNSHAEATEARFRLLTGEDAGPFINRLQDLPIQEASRWLGSIEGLGELLDRQWETPARPQYLSEHDDDLRSIERGYSETTLANAWRETTNQDMAASIMGYIRQAALGAALVPYEQRVEKALQRILASRAWSAPQRQWLQRIANQTKAITIVDREALDDDALLFRREGGGWPRLNQLFGGELDQVLLQFQRELWAA